MYLLFSIHDLVKRCVASRRPPVSFEERGVKRGIDVNGDLLVRRLPNLKEVERQSLVAALAAPEWRDPETGDPWL